MTSAFDDRIIRITIQFEGSSFTFEGLNIRATGQKFSSALSTACQCSIFNMTKTQRNYILTQTSPLNPNRTPVHITLEVGRKSYGTFVLFDGYVWKSTMVQPPDIGMMLECYTDSQISLQTVVRTYGSYTPLSVLAQNVANDCGLTLIFQATEKFVGNVSHSGSVVSQIKQINNVGGVIAYRFNNQLIVLDADKSVIGTPRVINSSNGMVGIPQITDVGILVNLMMDNTITLGGDITIESYENPVANGTYYVERIDFDVANREEPFWQSVQGKAKQNAQSTVS